MHQVVDCTPLSVDERTGTIAHMLQRQNASRTPVFTGPRLMQRTSAQVMLEHLRYWGTDTYKYPATISEKDS